MKLFFVTPNFTLFLSFALCMFCNTEILQAQSNIMPLNFSAVLKQHQVALTWGNPVEKEIDYFTVQRSLDGRHWESLVKIESSGQTDRAFHYQAIDVEPYEGQSFYRLLETNFENEIEMTPVVEVIFEVSMDQFFMSQDQAISKMKKSY